MSSRLSLLDGFTEFWAASPRKVGKLAAQKAYMKARWTFSAAEILQGLERYVQHMPADPQFRVHPATFLNQGRFLDEYGDAPKLKAATDWWEECKAVHGGRCVKRWDHEWLMKEEAN